MFLIARFLVSGFDPDSAVKPTSPQAQGATRHAFGAVQGYGFNVQRPIPTLNVEPLRPSTSLRKGCALRFLSIATAESRLKQAGFRFQQPET